MKAKYIGQVKLTKSDKDLIKGMSRWISSRIRDERKDAETGWITELERKLRRSWHKATVGIMVHKVGSARKSVRSKERYARMRRKWK